MGQIHRHQSFSFSTVGKCQQGCHSRNIKFDKFSIYSQQHKQIAWKRNKIEARLWFMTASKFPLLLKVYIQDSRKRRLDMHKMALENTDRLAGLVSKHIDWTDWPLAFLTSFFSVCLSCLSLTAPIWILLLPTNTLKKCLVPIYTILLLIATFSFHQLLS